jgi:hypothetical protein
MVDIHSDWMLGAIVSVGIALLATVLALLSIWWDQREEQCGGVRGGDVCGEVLK